MVATQKLLVSAQSMEAVRNIVGFNSRFPQNAIGENNLLQVAATASAGSPGNAGEAGNAGNAGGAGGEVVQEAPTAAQPADGPIVDNNNGLDPGASRGSKGAVIVSS